MVRNDLTNIPPKSILNDCEYNYIHNNVNRMVKDVDGLPIAVGSKLHPKVNSTIREHRAFSYII